MSSVAIERVIPIGNNASYWAKPKLFSEAVAAIKHNLPNVQVEPLICIQDILIDNHERHRLSRLIEHALAGDKTTLVLVYGGDGTIWRLWYCLLKEIQGNGYSTGHLILGHIPGGAFNVYAPERGISLKPAKLTAAIDAGRVIAQDYLTGRIVHAEGEMQCPAFLAFGFGEGGFLVEYEEARRVRKQALPRLWAKAFLRGMRRYEPTSVTIRGSNGIIFEHTSVAMVEGIKGPRFLHLKPTPAGLTVAIVPMAVEEKSSAPIRAFLGFYLAHFGWRNNPYLRQVSGEEFGFELNPPVPWHADAEPGKFNAEFAEIKLHRSGVLFLVNDQAAR